MKRGDQYEVSLYFASFQNWDQVYSLVLFLKTVFLIQKLVLLYRHGQNSRGKKMVS